MTRKQKSCVPEIEYKRPFLVARNEREQFTGDRSKLFTHLLIERLAKASQTANNEGSSWTSRSIQMNPSPFWCGDTRKELGAREAHVHLFFPTQNEVEVTIVYEGQPVAFFSDRLSAGFPYIAVKGYKRIFAEQDRSSDKALMEGWAFWNDILGRILDQHESR